MEPLNLWKPLGIRWQFRFKDLARHISSWSKDPSTQVGAVIVNQQKQVIGMGYNGFPRGVKDLQERYEDREQKYPRVVHAEINAVLNSASSVRGCALFSWPLNTCTNCAGMLIQAGIAEIYANLETDARWKKEWELAEEMYSEAGVEVHYI